MIDQSLAIGDYLPASSFIHRLDARTKIVSFFILLYCAFSSNTSTAASINLMFIMALAMLTSVPINVWTKCLLRFSPMLVLTFALNLFFSEPGFYYEINGVILPIGKNSLSHSFILTLQLLSAILLALILSFSTAPSAITSAIEWFTTPLALLKIPTSEFSMTIFLAMRFIPIFQQELQKIRDAQISRGIDFHSGSVLKKGKRLLGIFHPAFISTIRRSEMLAQAISSRGFIPGQKRSHFSRSHISKADIVAIIVLLLYSLLINIADYLIV